MANQDNIDKQTRQAEQQAQRGDAGQTHGDDKITRVTQNIATLLQRIIHEGLSVNGIIGIQGLTITSVDKAKDLGMLPAGSQGGPIMGQKGGMAMGQQSDQGQLSGGQQVSREEFDSLRQEIEQLKNMVGQKGGQAAGQVGQQAGEATQAVGQAGQQAGQQVEETGQQVAQQGQKGGQAAQQPQQEGQQQGQPQQQPQQKGQEQSGE